MTDTTALVRRLNEACQCRVYETCLWCQSAIALTQLQAEREEQEDCIKSYMIGLRGAQARLTALEAALAQFVDLFDGQVEPVPPHYWVIDLEKAKQLLAARTAAREQG